MERPGERQFNWSNTTDYLFLSDVLSIKNYWHKETLVVAFGITIASAIFAILLAISLSTNIFVILTTIIAFIYFALVIFKVWVVKRGYDYALVDFSQDQLDAITDEELPVYSVLVPLRDEADVIPQIIEAMTSLDYPSDKIDMIIPLETYDTDTIQAIEDARPPEYMRTRIIPYITPQTKPKTLNIIFPEVRGEFLVIYDAEIIPDRDQMKKAYLGFKHNPGIACFQTRLEHYNADQNILTKLFNMEFSFHYDFFLPGLQKLGFPIPLSGHSTHFRTEVVREIGAWDSYNVAEDCDLGMRLYRYGHKTAILNSLSQEEAASSIKSWIQQRTRWMKGFIQTSIVHLRHPLHFKNQIGGWKNFIAFLVTVPGTVLINFLNLASWIILAAWLLSGSNFIQDLYTTPILYLSVTAFVIGIFLFTYLNLIGSFNRNKHHLVKYGLLTPLYWMLLAYATTRAVYQTFTNPYVWEKTEHGTHLENK